MLPIDRTNLQAAAGNQVPNKLLGSALNIAAITTLYDGVDEVNNKVNTMANAGTLSRLGLINVKDYNASGSAQTTTGSITAGSNILTLGAPIDFINGHGIDVYGINEVASLQITAAATVASNVTVTLNGVAFLVAVLATDTAIQVATKIRAATYAGWVAGGTAGTDTVTFTATSTGNKTDATYSAGTTGALGTMTTPTQGTADLITSIVSGAGTTSLVLAVNATNTVSGVTVAHDDSVAIKTAIQAAVNANVVGQNIPVYFPWGNYSIRLTGVFSSITNTYRGGIKFTGAGWMNTIINLMPTGSPIWLYDNGNGNNRFQFCTFEDIQFSTNDSVNGNGFRLWSGGHEQGFKFFRCWFSNFNYMFETDGTVGNSEHKFFSCKMTYIQNRVFSINNPQSVNFELFGCDAENIYGDVFYVDAGGGGSVKVYGGSYILTDDGSNTDGYLLNIKSGSNTGTGNQDFMFIGIKTELRTIYAKLVSHDQGNVGLSTTSFIGCNLTTITGGNREVAVIDGNKRLMFDKCILGDFSFRIKGSNEAYPFAGSIEFIDSNVASNIADNIINETNYFSASARGCVSNGTSQPRKAINFDRNWENRGTMDREIPLKTITIKPYSLPYPYASGTEYTIILPKFATIKGIHIKKPAAGVTTSTYQLFVGSDDKVTIYGQSTLGAQNLDHIINATNLFVYTGSTKQTIRLWATGGDSIQNGGYAIVEYY